MEEKRKIRVKFGDYYKSFKPENSYIYKILSEKYDVEFSDDPEYFFGSDFGTEFIKYDCVRIFQTGEVITPNFNVYDYGLSFDYLSFGDRYLRMPNYYNAYVWYKDKVEAMQKKHIFDRSEIMKEKTEFCAFVVSNGGEYSDDRRAEFFHELMKYKHVNSGGRYLNNLAGTEFDAESGGVRDKIAFTRRHKFSITFENTSYPGYCTEKLMEGFAAQTIPIYWGDPLVGNTFNKRAFIDCNDYSSWDEVIAKIKEIDEDDEKYLAMLAEPALVDPDTVEKTRQAYHDFIYNIIDQPYEQAFRRDREGRMKKYNDNLREQIFCKNIVHSKTVFKYRLSCLYHSIFRRKKK